MNMVGPRRVADSDLSAAITSSSAESAHLDLLVENVHCAGCISKIERAVNDLDGISNARLNMSTHRLAVDFQPGLVPPRVILDTVTDLGYPAVPYRAARVGDASVKEERRLLLALAVAGFAAGNVMLLSVSVWAGAADMGGATRALFHWLSALIALPAIAFAGRPFFESAWSALRGRSMNMDVPISLAILLASGLSLAETVGGGPHAYFDAAVMLLFFLLIGRYLDYRARARARSAATQLLSMAGETARVVDSEGVERIVPVGEIAVGMIVAVAAGENIPVDGIVAAGASDIDTSLLTGEAVPLSIAPGAQVHAGTVNLTGPLSVRVGAVASDTLLADIVRLMESAERGRSAYVKLVDRIARLYAPAIHVLAIATFVLWWGILGADVRVALLNAVAVLIITCPCALGLAVPVVRVVAHGLLFARGVLVKSSDALERLAQIDTVIFDKTGTLTGGDLALIERPDDAVLAQAAALARGSRHPLSRAISDAAVGLDVPEIDDIHEVAGSGVEGTIAGTRVRLGRREWAAPGAADDQQVGAEIWFSAPDQTHHRFRFQDEVKRDAAKTVAALRSLGLNVWMLSGDRAATVAETARGLGIEDWRAECRPDDKVHTIQKFAAEGHRVLMVGDGLNDAPALTAGFVSASPAAASDISRTAADIVFQGEYLVPVLWMIQVARAAQSRVRENISLSVVYNVLAVPIAVLGYVTPLIAAVAMSTSSIVVTANAIRLRRLRLAEKTG